MGVGIAGASRTILDSTHRELNAHYTHVGAGVPAQKEMTKILVEGEKRSAVNTRTEYDALRSAVIAYSVVMVLKCSRPTVSYNIENHPSVCPFGRAEENTATHPYTHLELPSLNLQPVYLT
jgi:hypothetical protein